jgi:gamma-glutamyltranspeptidase/glutathione hydrolase
MMGSKVAAPGLGFLYAATMGYLGETRPGDRPFSSQSPLFVLRDRQPILVLGGAGARRILSAVVETVSRVIDQRMDLELASAEPRFHPLDARVDMENRPGRTLCGHSD